MQLMTIYHVKLIVLFAMVLMLSVNWGNIFASEKSDMETKVKAVAPLPLKVIGTEILNSKNKIVKLRGVNVDSLEWTSDGEGHILETVRVAIDDWKVNCVRLPLAQDRWFGKAPEQKGIYEPYRALVKEIVDLCSLKGCYIILDLHWSSAGQEGGTNIGQHLMPDRGSVAFWKDIAVIYANNPAVIFDLYNEPHDVSWNVWLNGGSVEEKSDSPDHKMLTYEAVGMQELLDTVRLTGAKNVVIAGGLGWAYDMSGFLEGKQLMDSDGNGVIYANHTYDIKGESVFKWISDMKKASAKVPVIVSEFGGSGGPDWRRGWWGQSPSTAMGDDWLLHVLQAIQDNNWSFTAWDLHPTAGPTLISGWDYKPTPNFGVYVKKLLVEGRLLKYTPPDLTTLTKEPITTLPETARIGGKELYGDWQLKTEDGKRGGSILAFSGDDEGRLVGQWIDSRGMSELEDVRFNENKVNFSQTVRFGKDKFKAQFLGIIDGDNLSGTFTHGGAQDKIEAGCIKEMMTENIQADSPLIGTWNLEVTSNWGSSKQRLKVNPDMSGMYGINPIEKINLEGDNISFKIVMEWGTYKFEMNFKGKLEGSTLTGEFSTSRGSQKVVGKKANTVR